VDNHLPTCQMWVEIRLGKQKTKTHTPAWQGFLLPLTVPLYILGQLFSDRMTENSELLVSLASVLKKLIHTPELTNSWSSIGFVHNSG
jgi:hypothetical protein